MNTFDIEFDDGDSEKRVELKRIKVKGGDRSRLALARIARSECAEAQGGSCARGRKSRRGTVWARRGKSPSSTSYHFITHRRQSVSSIPAKSTVARRDGTYDIAYDT